MSFVHFNFDLLLVPKCDGKLQYWLNKMSSNVNMKILPWLIKLKKVKQVMNRIQSMHYDIVYLQETNMVNNYLKIKRN